MNSLAFSFLGEIPEIFAGPIIERMGSTPVDVYPEEPFESGLSYREEWGDIWYIVPEYDFEKMDEQDYFTPDNWLKEFFYKILVTWANFEWNIK